MNPGVRGGGETSSPDASGPETGWWTPWALLAFALAYLAWFWSDPIGPGVWSPHGPAMIQPGNSTSFLDFGDPRWATRWAGYPVFLNLVEGLFGGLGAVPQVQLVLAAGSIWFLGYAAHRALSASGFALALALGLFALSAVVRFHAYLLSEALFVPLATGVLGAILLFARRPRTGTLLAASALSGLAVTARPAGALLLAIWPVAAWWLRNRTRGRRLRFGAALILPLAACFLIENAAWNRAYPDLDHRPSIVDRHLFAKALLLPSERVEIPEPEWREFFREARLRAEPLRRAVADASGFPLRPIVLRRAEDALQHPLYRRWFRVPAEELAERRGESPTGRLGEWGRAALLAAPAEWAANAAVHFVGLWTLPTLHTADFARALSAYGETLPDTPVVRDAARLAAPIGRSRQAPAWVVGIVRFAGAASFATCLSALVLVARRRLRAREGELDLRLLGAALAAVILLGYYSVLAVFNYSSLRYSAAMWPFLWFAVAEIGRRALAGRWRGRSGESVR